MIDKAILVLLGVAVASAYPMPHAFPYAMPQDCCMPGPGCSNPCYLPPPPPPPPPACCMPAAPPAPPCLNPCGGFQKAPKQPVVYAPLPGEIVFKMSQTFTPELLDNQSPYFQIMEGNVRSAVQAVLGKQTAVTNVYFREGYVPGNPPSRPKTVAHMMVNGGSDAASILATSVTPDGSLGDGLRVYRDSFNAY